MLQNPFNLCAALISVKTSDFHLSRSKSRFHFQLKCIRIPSAFSVEKFAFVKTFSVISERNLPDTDTSQICIANISRFALHCICIANISQFYNSQYMDIYWSKTTLCWKCLQYINDLLSGVFKKLFCWQLWWSYRLICLGCQWRQQRQERCSGKPKKMHNLRSMVAREWNISKGDCLQSTCEWCKRMHWSDDCA